MNIEGTVEGEEPRAAPSVPNIVVGEAEVGNGSHRPVVCAVHVAQGQPLGPPGAEGRAERLDAVVVNVVRDLEVREGVMVDDEGS